MEANMRHIVAEFENGHWKAKAFKTETHAKSYVRAKVQTLLHRQYKTFAEFTKWLEAESIEQAWNYSPWDEGFCFGHDSGYEIYECEEGSEGVGLAFDSGSRQAFLIALPDQPDDDTYVKFATVGQLEVEGAQS